MPKKIGQVRYYGTNSNGVADSRNWPATLTHAKMRSGTAFSDVYPIVQLGIQTLPGVKVFINNHSTPIVIGSTGIYELNVDGLSRISNISFDINSLNVIDNNSNAYIIVDYIYDKED